MLSVATGESANPCKPTEITLTHEVGRRVAALNQTSQGFTLQLIPQNALPFWPISTSVIKSRAQLCRQTIASSAGRADPSRGILSLNALSFTLFLFGSDAVGGVYGVIDSRATLGVSPDAARSASARAFSAREVPISYALYLPSLFVDAEVAAACRF
jgi:hypothetical protein